VKKDGARIDRGEETDQAANDVTKDHREAV
jgi:hypothetical protein